MHCIPTHDGDWFGCKACGRTFAATDPDDVVRACRVKGAIPQKRKPCGTPCHEPPKPSLLAMAGNLTSYTAHWLANGGRTATEAQQIERLAICEDCPLYRSSDRSCADCGCYLPLKAAGRELVSQSDCPKEHWPVIG